MLNKYKILDKKLKKLKQVQNTDKTITTPQKFYTRVVNNTNINFSNGEMAILNKGLKYNLTSNVETGFPHLPPKPKQQSINYPHQNKTPSDSKSQKKKNIYIYIHKNYTHNSTNTNITTHTTSLRKS